MEEANQAKKRRLNKTNLNVLRETREDRASTKQEMDESVTDKRKKLNTAHAYKWECGQEATRATHKSPNRLRTCRIKVSGKEVKTLSLCKGYS